MDMESSLLFVIFMAVVQGIAEFLPISSSGHLALLGRIFNFDAEANATLNIILHAGTLLSIVVYYFKELFAILKEKQFDLVGKLIIATIPVGLVGMLVKALKWDETLFNNLYIVGAGFIATATLLFFCRGKDNGKEIKELTYKQSFLIGLAQSIAVLPGVSRSGSTISSGLKLGLNRADAARFSFLMAIPAIGGVVAVKLFMLLKKGELTLNSLGISDLVIGFTVSAAVGYFALALLLRILKRGNFIYFSYYLYLLGLVTLIWAVFN